MFECRLLEVEPTTFAFRRTGKVIPKKPRGDDGLENFEAYFDDDGATSPSINGPEKASRPSAKRRSSVALSDAGSDMDLTGSGS